MPTPMWTPPPEMVERAVMTRFMREHGFETYDELWRWSVEDLEGFWSAIWDFFDVGPGSGPALAERTMPGARWFPECEVNYAAHAFRSRDDGALAILHASELRELGRWTWGDLRAQAAAV